MATIAEVLANEDPTSFAIALSNLVFPRYDRDGFEGLLPAERVAYCVDALEREVNNGGFAQFFENSSGDASAEAVAALEEIGAAQAADLLRRAINLFPGGAPPRNRDARLQLLDAMSDGRRSEWGELDQRFCSYPDDLTALMRRFVETHRSEFRDWP